MNDTMQVNTNRKAPVSTWVSLLQFSLYVSPIVV
jgi:hypothetical protein